MISLILDEIMSSKLPITCPSCENVLIVSELTCESCQTKVSGAYLLPKLLQLSMEEQQFVLDFFLASGSLKEMAAKVGVSYPTLRNRLDDLIVKIQKL